MKEHLLTGGTSVLNIRHSKLFKILSINFYFQFQKKIHLLFVLYVILIKYINNLFVPIVYTVMLRLISFTLMFGIPLVTLELMGQDTILFLLINSLNIYGFIQCSRNQVFLAFFHISKMFLKIVSKQKQNLFTPTMVENSLPLNKPYLLQNGAHWSYSSKCQPNKPFKHGAHSD